MPDIPEVPSATTLTEIMVPVQAERSERLKPYDDYFERTANAYWSAVKAAVEKYPSLLEVPKERKVKLLPFD